MEALPGPAWEQLAQPPQQQQQPPPPPVQRPFQVASVSKCHIQTGVERFGRVLDEVLEEREEVAMHNPIAHAPGGIEWLQWPGVDPKIYEPGQEPSKYHVIPSTLGLRNNLTALSNVHNLYFVAYRTRIFVYRPRGAARQSIPKYPDLQLIPRRTSFARRIGGFIDVRIGHTINHVITGFLGRQEILLMALDDGDVVAYYTNDIAWHVWHKANPADQPPEPFFVRTVGKTAWGLAIHSKSRLIAVSSNLRELTVFAFALSSDKKETPGCCGCGHGAERQVRQRRRDWRILIPLPRMASNIPSISFLDDRSGEAEKVCAVDINGTVWLAHIWRANEAPRMLSAVNRKLHSQEWRGTPSKGWGVLPLVGSDFLTVSSTEELLGGSPQPQRFRRLGHPATGLPAVDIVGLLQNVQDNPCPYVSQPHNVAPLNVPPAPINQDLSDLVAPLAELGNVLPAGFVDIAGPATQGQIGAGVDEVTGGEGNGEEEGTNEDDENEEAEEGQGELEVLIDGEEEEEQDEEDFDIDDYDIEDEDDEDDEDEMDVDENEEGLDDDGDQEGDMLMPEAAPPPPNAPALVPAPLPAPAQPALAAPASILPADFIAQVQDAIWSSPIIPGNTPQAQPNAASAAQQLNLTLTGSLTGEPWAKLAVTWLSDNPIPGVKPDENWKIQVSSCKHNASSQAFCFGCMRCPVKVTSSRFSEMTYCPDMSAIFPGPETRGGLSYFRARLTQLKERRQMRDRTASRNKTPDIGWDGYHILRTFEQDFELFRTDEGRSDGQPREMGIMCTHALPINIKTMPELQKSAFRAAHRLNMIAHMPELHLVALGSPIGKVMLITPTRLARPEALSGNTKNDSAYWQYGFRVDWILPRRSDEAKYMPRSRRRPLHGMAVGLLPQDEDTVCDQDSEDVDEGEQRGAGEPALPRRYRLMLHYRNHDIVTYQVSRDEQTGRVVIF